MAATRSRSSMGSVPIRQNCHGSTRDKFVFKIGTTAVVWITAIVIVSQGFVFVPRAISQTKEQAVATLRQMSPAEVDRRLMEMGMTRQEAIQKAATHGITLQDYLSKESSSVSVQVQRPVIITSTGDTVDALAPDSVQPRIADAVSLPEGKKWYATDEGLKYFGYDIFDGVPNAFEPTAVGPADAEYLIGPEDVLRLVVWGQAEFQYELIVDKEGKVFIPTVGQFLVSGMTLEKATDRLRSALSRSYSGLAGPTPTVWMDLSISRLRPKRIFIMGEVRKPGGYTVHSYATVFNSLYSIGGPTLAGSLRDIRVLRNNKLVARVDLYDYFTGATEVKDVRVQTNDIIYVPVRGKTVTLRGQVRNPAIYEMKQGESLQDLIEAAGGFLATAHVEKIRIDRILPFQERTRGEAERKELTIDYAALSAQKRPVGLEDRDEVFVGSFVDLKRNFVTIQGPVTRPGMYQFERFRTLRSLILGADSLLPNVYTERVDVRRMRPDSSLVWYQLDLAKVMGPDASEDFSLQPWDAVTIYSKSDLIPRRTVSVFGHVKNPGEYPFADSLMLSDLLFRAGGLQDSLFRSRTFMHRADLLRLSSDGITKMTIPFPLDSLLFGDKSHDRPLHVLDEIHVYPIDVQRLTERFVTVHGRVRNPGQFVLTANMTLEDAILLAGGLTEDAYRLKVEISRMRDSETPDDTLSRIMTVDAPDFSDTSFAIRARAGADHKRFTILQHRDQIFVREDPDFLPQRLISVEGEVKYPGVYALQKHNERLSDLIKRAGNVTPSGYLAGGAVYRSGSRITVEFDEAIARPRGDNDVILSEGDVITIPRKPHAVTVIGEVGNPGITGYVDGNTLWDYVDRAGWVTDSAKHVYVTFPSGDVKMFNPSWLSRVFSQDPKIPDGTTIRVSRVPPEPEGQSIDLGGTIKDVFAILASAVTILVLARQL